MKIIVDLNLNKSLGRVGNVFVIHENFNSSHDYTRIHLGDCHFFINRKSDQTENTNWFYPYFTYQVVRDTAIRLGRKNGPYNCSYCIPERHKEHRLSATESNFPRK